MDDDETMRSILDLMSSRLDVIESLHNRESLRRLGPEEKPSWVGGTKKYQNPQPDGLHAEFLRSSMDMHRRLRPKLEELAMVKSRRIHSKQWNEMKRDLKKIIKERGENEDQPRMLFQLQRHVERIPGWVDLQQEVRQIDPSKLLKPVQYDGFYIVKEFPTKNGVAFVL